jgi:MSHA pilin protein MshD
MSPAADLQQRRQRGLTLVELVLSIVIISIAVTGVLSAYATMVSRSADPLIDVQAVAIAEAYMDEILSKPLTGPAPSGGRDTYTTVGDYDAISNESPPRNQFDQPIGSLAAYTVDVSVAGEDVAGVTMQAIVVTVSHSSGRSITLRSHRVDN